MSNPNVDMLHIAIYLLGTSGFTPQEAITKGPELAKILNQENVKQLLTSAWDPTATWESTPETNKLNPIGHALTRGITSR